MTSLRPIISDRANNAIGERSQSCPIGDLPYGLRGTNLKLEDEFSQLTSLRPGNMPMNPANLLPVAVVSVLAFRMYGRVRKNIGRQPMQHKRLIARTIIFAVVTCVLAVFCVIHPQLLMGLAGGLVLGVLLALVGLRL